jgi:hypothetical protein
MVCGAVVVLLVVLVVLWAGFGGIAKLTQCTFKAHSRTHKVQNPVSLSTSIQKLPALANSEQF